MTSEGDLAVDTATVILCDPCNADAVLAAIDRSLIDFPYNYPPDPVVRSAAGVVIGYILRPSTSFGGVSIGSDGLYPVAIEYETDADGMEWPVNLSISLR